MLLSLSGNPPPDQPSAFLDNSCEAGMMSRTDENRGSQGVLDLPPVATGPAWVGQGLVQLLAGRYNRGRRARLTCVPKAGDLIQRCFLLRGEIMPLAAERFGGGKLMPPQQRISRRRFLGATAATAGGILMPGGRRLAAKPIVAPASFPQRITSGIARSRPGRTLIRSATARHSVLTTAPFSSPKTTPAPGRTVSPLPTPRT